MPLISHSVPSSNRMSSGEVVLKPPFSKEIVSFLDFKLTQLKHIHPLENIQLSNTGMLGPSLYFLDKVA